MEETSQARLLFKCFLHGLLFYLLNLVLGIVWTFVSVMLVFVGLFLGLIIGLVGFVFLFGALNAVITEYLWKVQIRMHWTNLLAHGFVLMIVLFLVQVPGLILSVYYQDLYQHSVTIVATFIIYCFINGFFAKKVSSYWQEESVEDVFSNFHESEVVASTHENVEQVQNEKVNVEQLYKKMLLDSVTQYGSVSGKSMLDANIKSYVKKGVTKEEAIIKLAKARGYTSD